MWKLKKIKTTYVIGFFVCLLIASLIYILRNFNLSDPEIGLISAIVGGFISGGLTLIGVKATLDNQQRKEFLNEYPKVKVNTEEIICELKNLLSKIPYEKKINESRKTNEMVFLLKKFEEKNLFVISEKSIICGGEIFSLVTQIKVLIINLNSDIRKEISLKSNEMGEDMVSYDISGNYFSNKINLIDDQVKSIERELFIIDKKFKRHVKTN